MIIYSQKFANFRVPAIPKSPVVNTTFSRTPNLTVKRKLDDEMSDQVKKPMIEENPSEVDASDELGQLNFKIIKMYFKKIKLLKFD